MYESNINKKPKYSAEYQILKILQANNDSFECLRVK